PAPALAPGPGRDPRVHQALTASALRPAGDLGHRAPAQGGPRLVDRDLRYTVDVVEDRVPAAVAREIRRHAGRRLRVGDPDGGAGLCRSNRLRAALGDLGLVAYEQVQRVDRRRVTFEHERRALGQ